MTKYLDKSFSSPANSKAYVDNWERIFGKKEYSDPGCHGYDHNDSCHRCEGGESCPMRCECRCHCTEHRKVQTDED